MKTVEDVRRFWDARPCNIRHSPKPVGTREYFEEVRARKYRVEPHIPGFAEFPRWRGKKVLEVGCGMGTDSVEFARAGAEVTAVELSEVSLRIAKDRAKIYRVDNIKFYAANAEELTRTVPVETYDLVYAFGVLHHTPRPERVFEEMRAYCGPHTEVRIMLYSKWSFKVLWIAAVCGRGAFWRTRKFVPEYSEAQTGSPVSYVYSHREIRRLLKDYEITDIRKAHIFPYRIDAYIRHEYVYTWYFRWTPVFLFRQLERALGWHTLIVGRLKQV